MQHLYGFGHLSMRVAKQGGAAAVAHGIESVGLVAGSTQRGGMLGAGWNRQELVTVGPAADVAFSWPTGNFLLMNFESMDATSEPANAAGPQEAAVHCLPARE